MREIGSLACTTRPRQRLDGENWPASTVVRIDTIENVERQVYRVHSADGRSAEVGERDLRDVAVEDDTWAFEPGVLEPEPANLRAFYAEKAGTILRSRAPFGSGPDVIHVILLAAYMENGLSPEMVEQFEKSLRAVLERVENPVRETVLSEAEERRRKDEALLAEIDSKPQEFVDKTTVSAGALKPGDGTEFWKVLEREGETRDGVLFRIALVKPDDDQDQFITLHMLKSTPIDVISRIVT